MKKLGFGFMRLPVFDEQDRSTVDLEAVKKMVDCFMERGFSYFDTAHRYNDEASEPALRECLVKRYPRDSFVLTDKITFNYIKNEEDQWPFFMKQLEDCGVEYFDNYLIHNLGAVFYPYAQKYHTFDFLMELKEKGYVHHVGFSFHGTADVLEQILKEHPETELVQLQLNYLDWEDEGIQSRKCYETACKYGKKVIVMEPVKGGTLANLPEEAEAVLKKCNPDNSLASWALRFAAEKENVIMVLSGMTTMEQVKDNTACMSDFVPLSEKEAEVLDKAVEMIRSHSEIPCTDCRYCVTDCPKQIAIPDYFSLFNNYKRLENTAYMYNQKVYYANLVQKNGKASDCIGCGKCEKNCPQHIEIRKQLQRVARVLE